MTETTPESCILGSEVIIKEEYQNVVIERQDNKTPNYSRILSNVRIWSVHTLALLSMCIRWAAAFDLYLFNLFLIKLCSLKSSACAMLDLLPYYMIFG